MPTKRIVCLANSRKLSGRCVAGRELVADRPEAWVRPVSAREHQEVSEHERQYQDGSDPTLLDVVDVPLLEHRPKDYQQENWLLDPEYYWTKVDRCSWEDLDQFSEAGGNLWPNGFHTHNGTNDQIPLQQAAEETSSLKLIHVDEVCLRVFAPGQVFGNSKRRVQARFHFSGSSYALWVTDPYIERHYLAQEDGSYDLAECYLTISLGEPFKKRCYKLVAAVMERP